MVGRELPAAARVRVVAVRRRRDVDRAREVEPALQRTAGSGERKRRHTRRIAGAPRRARAARDRREKDVTGNAVARRAVVNATRRVGKVRGPREVALSRGDRIDLVIVERAEEVELVLAEIAPAARHAVALLLSAALFRIAVEGEGFDAGVVLTQNEVDHA